MAYPSYMSAPVSRSEREVRRALLHDALKHVAETDDPDRAAYEAMRALDAYLDAQSAPAVAPREPAVMGERRPESQVRWVLGAIMAGAVIATVVVAVTMSGGWPAGIAVSAIWLTTLLLLLSAS